MVRLFVFLLLGVFEVFVTDDACDGTFPYGCTKSDGDNALYCQIGTGSACNYRAQSVEPPEGYCCYKNCPGATGASEDACARSHSPTSKAAVSSPTLLVRRSVPTYMTEEYEVPQLQHAANKLVSVPRSFGLLTTKPHPALRVRLAPV